jgi:hypothetical protein
VGEEKVRTLGISMKQEEYEKFRKLTLEFIERLNDDPEMVEALKNCPDPVALPILVGLFEEQTKLFEEQTKSSIVAQTSMKFAATASIIAAASMAISAVSLAIVSGNLLVGIVVIVVVAMGYMGIKEVSRIQMSKVKKPDLHQ